MDRSVEVRMALALLKSCLNSKPGECPECQKSVLLTAQEAQTLITYIEVCEGDYKYLKSEHDKDWKELEKLRRDFLTLQADYVVAESDMKDYTEQKLKALRLQKLVNLLVDKL